MAKLLVCPECEQVMHRVSQATIRSAEAGFDQLARHCFEQHFITFMESMLQVSVEYGRVRGMGIEDYKEMLAIFCGNCSRRMRYDTPYYAQIENRTVHCCSSNCLAALKSR